MSRIFTGVIPTSTTRYFPVSIVDGTIGAHLAWKDATSSATITLELSGYEGLAVTVDGAAWEWTPSGITITGPAASAAGSVGINVENVRQKNARIKVVTAAVTTIDVLDNNLP